MITKTIDLSGDGRVCLRCFLNDWSLAGPKLPRRPAVLILPGGAYTVISNAEGDPVAMRFAADGFQSFVLSYSIGENAVFPASVADAGRALMLIRENAQQWSVDPSAVAVCGFSAGGHVAACLAAMWNRQDILRACGCTGEENRPDAVILGYACTSVDLDSDDSMWRLLAGHRELEQIAYLASADSFVDSRTPPTFIMCSYDDQLVPVEQSLRFASALAAADVPFELHVFEHGVHGSALFTPATSLGTPDNEDAHAALWYPMCLDWLMGRFPPPKYKHVAPAFGVISGHRAHMGQKNLPDSIFDVNRD